MPASYLRLTSEFGRSLTAMIACKVPIEGQVNGFRPNNGTHRHRINMPSVRFTVNSFYLTLSEVGSNLLNQEVPPRFTCCFPVKCRVNKPCLVNTVLLPVR